MWWRPRLRVLLRPHSVLNRWTTDRRADCPFRVNRQAGSCVAALEVVLNVAAVLTFNITGRLLHAGCLWEEGRECLTML